MTRHTIDVDGHPLAMWSKRPPPPPETTRGAIVFLHGRTWSAVPDFDLQVKGEQRSVMDAFVEQGFATYALDLRGYGESPRDATGWLTPDRAADDLAVALKWVHEREREFEEDKETVRTAGPYGEGKAAGGAASGDRGRPPGVPRALHGQGAWLPGRRASRAMTGARSGPRCGCRQRESRPLRRARSAAP